MSDARAEDLSDQQAQSSPAPSSDAKQQKIKKSCKTDRLDTGEKEGFYHEPPLQKLAEYKKPSGKRKCKTKHLEEQGTRKRPYLAEDESFDTEHSEDTVAVPKEVMKQAESTRHRGSLPAKPRKQKQRKQLQQSTLLPNPQQETLQVPKRRQPMPREARSISVNENAGETLLQRAAYLGHQKVVLYCLKNNVCDIHHHDDLGYCALHEACFSGWLSIARLLLKNGAHVNCYAQGGIGPIHDAVLNDYLDIVHLLLSYGANPLLPCSGMTIFQMTRSNSMATFLAQNLTDLYGWSAHDPELYWDFYSSFVCNPIYESQFDVLENPPGPDEVGSAYNWTPDFVGLLPSLHNSCLMLSNINILVF